MRGKVFVRLTRLNDLRITPAYAGKSSLLEIHFISPLGSPPHMRGKEQHSRESSKTAGITPAYAGKSVHDCMIMWSFRDHPRICGEKISSKLLWLTRSGSPPHMRGKVGEDRSDWKEFGITPAYAGKRPVPAPGGGETQDHPRICGEKRFLEG